MKTQGKRDLSPTGLEFHGGPLTLYSNTIQLELTTFNTGKLQKIALESKTLIYIF